MSTADITAGMGSDDPEVGFRAVVAMRRMAQQLEESSVHRARMLGWSWEEIGDALGVSRQSVHKKYRGAL